MQITVSIQLVKDDPLPTWTTDEAATLVLAALGDTVNDYCTVSILGPQVPGMAGTPPPPQAPFFEQKVDPPPT